MGTTLTLLHQSFPTAELILVSDGSTDATGEVARGLPFAVEVLEHHPNRGKGFSVRRGMLAARGQFRVFTDADLPFGTSGIGEMIESFAGGSPAEVVIAQKLGERKHWFYRLSRSVVRNFVTWRTGLDYPDTQAGLKGFSDRAARCIFGSARIDGFAMDIEVLCLARCARIPIGLMPMALTHEHERPSTFGFRHGLKLLADIFRIGRCDA